MDGPSEENIAIQYRNAVNSADKQAEEIILKKFFFIWRSRIKSIHYKIWSCCRALEFCECSGSNGTSGMFAEPTYLGIRKALLGFDPGKKLTAYIWKTVYGKCSNYCLRSCYIGREIISRVPLYIKDKDFRLYTNNKNGKYKEIANTLINCYKLDGDNGFKLIKNRLSIKKALTITNFFEIRDGELEHIRDYPEVNFMHKPESPVTVCVDEIVNIAAELPIMRRLIVFFLCERKLTQKEIGKALRISECKLSREIRGIEEEISFRLLEVFPPMRTNKTARRDFESLLECGKRLTIKDKKFLEEKFSLKNESYVFNSGDEQDLIKANRIFMRSGCKSIIDLRQLQGIYYFQRRFKERIGNSLEKHGNELIGEIYERRL